MSDTHDEDAKYFHEKLDRTVERFKLDPSREAAAAVTKAMKFVQLLSDVQSFNDEANVPPPRKIWEIDVGDMALSTVKAYLDHIKRVNLVATKK